MSKLLKSNSPERAPKPPIPRLSKTPDTDAVMFTAEVSDLDRRLLGIGTSTVQCTLATHAAILEHQRNLARAALVELLEFFNMHDTEAGFFWTAADRQYYFGIAGFADPDHDRKAA